MTFITKEHKIDPGFTTDRYQNEKSLLGINLSMKEVLLNCISMDLSHGLGGNIVLLIVAKHGRSM